MYDLDKRLDGIENELTLIRKLLTNAQPNYNFEQHNTNKCIDCYNKACGNVNCPNRMSAT